MHFPCKINEFVAINLNTNDHFVLLSQVRQQCCPTLLIAIQECLKRDIDDNRGCTGLRKKKRKLSGDQENLLKLCTETRAELTRLKKFCCAAVYALEIGKSSLG